MSTRWQVCLAAVFTVLLGLLVFACSPGSTPAPIPGNTGGGEDPGTGGGDPREPVFYAPSAVGQLLDGQTFDSNLVDVSANEDFVYVLSKNSVYAFSKTTNFQNVAAVPNPVGKGIAVLPDNSSGIFQNPLPKHVAVTHTPGPGDGGPCVVAIFGPNLDPFSTRVDDTEPAFRKWLALPRYWPIEITFPNATQPDQLPEQYWEILADEGCEVTRDGSILIKAALGWHSPDLIEPDPRVSTSIVLFDAANQDTPYVMYFPDAGNGTGGSPVPFFDLGFFGTPFAVGRGTQFALALPLDPEKDDPIDYFVNEATTTLDFVGVTTFFEDKLDAVSFPNYDWKYNFPGRASALDYIDSYKLVIGQTFGAAPGSFSPNPPVIPAGLQNAGALEDADLNAGGPAGSEWDPVNRRVYICDPGNRRVQVFQKNSADGSYSYFGQIGDGNRGTAGNSLIAPKTVHVDHDGTVYICDVDRIRIFNRNSGRQQGFGSLAGTVRKMPGSIPLPDANVFITSSQGQVASVNTDINGQYKIENLAIGRYFVTATSSFGNLENDFSTVQILYDQQSIANFNLWDRTLTQTVTGTLVGTVYDDATSKPLQNASLRLIDGNGIEYNKTFTTSNIGTFTVPDLEAGYWDNDNVWHPTTWQVIASAEFYNTTTTYFELLPRSTVSIEIRLKPKLE